jgi:hypothetical protein
MAKWARIDFKAKLTKVLGAEQARKAIFAINRAETRLREPEATLNRNVYWSEPRENP